MKQFKNTLYYWKGKNIHGHTLFGEVLGFSSNLVKAQLLKRGIQPILITKAKRHYFKKAINPFDIILFFRQLATLIKAGISASQAIHILSQNTNKIKFFRVILLLKDEVTAGNGLAVSLQKFPHYFDAITCHLILAGEKSGTLETILENIAHQKENLYLLKNKIKQALFYPILIFLVCIFVTFILLIFVMPRFKELFENMHATLPPFTLFILSLSQTLRNNWFLILFFLLLINIFYYLTRYFKRLRYWQDVACLYTPVIGSSIQKFILSNWSRHLAIIYAAGIPITEALKMLIQSTRNLVYQEAIQNLYLDITAGKQLHFAMQKSKIFPPMMVRMIQMGEESGTLEKMLKKIADFYESDIDHTTNHLARLIEPLIMVFLGVVIGGLVIAMYLPIFKLGAVI